jgi:uncharacterized protein YcbK (DUF882 family)
LRARSPIAGAAAVVAAAVVGTAPIIAAFPTTRTISLYNIHTKETLTIEYKRNGKFLPAAMDRIDWVLRDWRRDEKTSMDPELIDLLWEIHTELGSREPIHVISAFRSRATNDMLRRTVGGQASESRHILGKAADVHFPDVALKKIRYSALIRERGGVGYYPTSATPFVHVDTDRVRHWPRLPRAELALLFPNGRSQHVPADGQPIGPDDVQGARMRHGELAVQIAAYHEERQAWLRAPARIAAATQPARVSSAPPALPGPPAKSADRGDIPKLVAEPRLVDRPSRLTGTPSEEDRRKLNQLAALASHPTLVAGPELAKRPGKGSPPVDDPGASALANGPANVSWGVPHDGWVGAPAYDEEHPEELSYRPFPIAPYLTATPSADDPALARLVHPDVSKTLELLDQAGSMPPMRLRPGQQVARLMWAQQFRGGAVAVEGIFEETSGLLPGGFTRRSVQTSER